MSEKIVQLFISLELGISSTEDDGVFLYACDFWPLEWYGWAFMKLFEKEMESEWWFIGNSFYLCFGY